MTTFALVHGAWHGSWCWDRLVPLLERAGHRTVAVDLPCEDPAATFDDYADVVVTVLEGHDDVVLVGHSLGGLTVPVVAARRPVRRVVFLCSLVPSPGRSLVDRIGEEPQMLLPDYRAGLEVVDDRGTTRWVDEDLARDVLYGGGDDAHEAFAQLRAQAVGGYRVPCSLTAMPDVPSTYVVCTEDRMVDPAWSRRVAREELGAELVELPGDHSPFLSRPAELADVLLSRTA